jgi:hypothetical protein
VQLALMDGDDNPYADPSPGGVRRPGRGAVTSMQKHRSLAHASGGRSKESYLVGLLMPLRTSWHQRWAGKIYSI